MNISKTTSGLIALLFAVPFACAQSYIPQIADGGGWQTTIVLTNTSPSATTASLAFYQETTGGATQTWNPPFQEVTSTQTISIAGGATVFLHTTNTAKTTSVGWAQLNGGFTVVAYAIFTQFVTGRQNQDGTAPAAAGTTRVLVPYDNTNGFLTTVAIANPAALSESIATGISTTGGSVFQPAAVTIPALGHMAFSLPAQFPVTTGQAGLAEFYVTSGSLSIVALRFNPSGAFTAAPVYPQTGAPIIGSTTGGTLPQFTEIDIVGDAGTSVGVNSITLRSTGTSAGGYKAALSGQSSVASYSANWTTVTVTGQTLSFDGLQVGSSSMQTSQNFAPITSAYLTISLSPQNGNISGTVSGFITLTSSLATISGSFTGTYTAQ